MAKARRQPFEVRLPEDRKQELALEWSRALDDALSAASASEAEIRYWWTLYEQGRTRTGATNVWADAADLTSYLGTQYVDVLRSQIVESVMSEPVFTVEGYGEAAPRAPFVEEFHQWQLEAEGFQQVFSRGAHAALVEPRGVLEVYQDTIRRPVRKTIRAALQLAPDGTALINAQGQPVLARQSETDDFVEVTDELTPSAEVEIDSYETVGRGPRMRTIAYRDYLSLPTHAKERSEVWGHAKRFHLRVDQLKERASKKIYDPKTVEDLGTDDERASETTLSGQSIGMAAKEGTDRAEKELWELLVLQDLDGKGLRWYVTTLHKDKQRLLRLQYDDLGRPRYFSLVPFPRPNSLEGYSYVGHKLITIIEEHTAWRNMLADRAAMQLQAPIKRLQGALWDPDTEPMGPKAVIPVRDMREIEPMQFPDATGPAIERIRDAERAGERVSGINDASAGVTSQDQRTLGEVRIITNQSRGRTNEAVKNIQETLEEIAQVRHLMWKRALAEMGTDGLELPPSVLQGLELRGADVSTYLPNQRMTALMLEGAFRFKPRGSVDNADRHQLRLDFSEWLKAMSVMASVNPMVAMILQSPQAAKALIEQGVRLYNVQDKQAFLGSEAFEAAMQQMQMMQAGAAPSGAGPGAPDALPMAA